MPGNDRAKKKVSAFDIRQSYSTEKARSDLVAQTWLYLVLRPLSFHLTPFFINIGFSANVFTLLGLIPLLVGMVFIVLGATSWLNFVIGAVFINIWYLCDAIDGNIARFQSQTSKLGALLDWLVGMIYHTFLPVCLGVGLYLTSSVRPVFDFGLGLPNWFWLLAGAVELFAELFREVVSMQGRRIVGEQIANQIDSEVTIKAILPRAILSFQMPMLLVSSLVGALGIFLIFYAVYNLGTLVGMVILSLRKALLADRQQMSKEENT